MNPSARQIGARAARRPETLRGLTWAWADEIGIRPKRVEVRQLTRKWASCSTSGRLILSRRLLREGRGVQDYVIVHELLHLRVPNHGKLFKRLMDVHLGQNKRGGA